VNKRITKVHDRGVIAGRHEQISADSENVGESGSAWGACRVTGPDWAMTLAERGTDENHSAACTGRVRGRGPCAV
jgi:hypothetical protein